MSDTILLHNGSNLVSEGVKLFQKPPTGVSSGRRRVTSSDGEGKREEDDRNVTYNGKRVKTTDDSGFQSNLSKESLENCEISQDNEDSDEQVVETGVKSKEPQFNSAAPSPQPSRPPSRQMTQVRRRSSFTISRPTGPLVSPSRAPSLRRTATVTQDYDTASRKSTLQYLPGSLVAQTVAERRARAEALDAERRRKHQEKLEASEAALQAACQRAQSLRAARSAELRSKEEEKRARVTERRKMLEKNREELLNRRISRVTASQTHDHQFRQQPSRVSVCGFSSDLDPSDPRYCPFGFGSSSRRDVCFSTKQQLISSKPPQAVNKLYTSIITNSPSRAGKASAQMSSSTYTFRSEGSANLNISRSIKEKKKGLTNSNQNTLNKCNSNKVVRLSTFFTTGDKRVKSSTEVNKTSYLTKVSQPTPDNVSASSHSGVPTRSGLHGRPRSVRSIKNMARTPDVSSATINPKTVRRRNDTPNATPKCPPINVSAGCEPSEADAQIYRARIKEQRRIVRERKRLEEEENSRKQREEELNEQLEEMARVTVSEAIYHAIAELKAEAVEASDTISGTDTVAFKAAQLLSYISTGNNLIGSTLGDNKDVLESAISTSKKVLSNAVENMTLSATTDCISKSQSEIINVLSNATSAISGREKRRSRLDEIMNQVRTTSDTSSISNGHENSVAPLTITVSCVNDVNGEERKRYQLKPCGAIKSMLESGRLPENSTAAVLLRNRIARYEQFPPIELCSPLSEASNASEFETRTVIEHSPKAPVTEKSRRSLEDSGNEQDSRADTDWNTSSASTTVAVCFPLNRRVQPDELLHNQHSSCSDVSTNSD